MGGGPHRACRLRRNGRIMQHAQQAVAHVHLALEELGGKAEIPGNRPQHLPPERIHCRVQIAHMLPEAVDVLNPHIFRHPGAVGVARRQFPACVPELLEVVRACALGRFDAERRIAARTRQPRLVIPTLLRIRPAEEGFEPAEGCVDQLLRQAMIRHHGKTVLDIRPPKGFGEACRVSQVKVVADRWNCARHSLSV